jgi:hypothetical protein
MRRWKLWDYIAAFYRIQVWRQHYNRTPEKTVEKLHRLWGCSVRPELYFSKKRFDLAKEYNECSVWIAHPHGALPWGVIFSLGFYGTRLITPLKVKDLDRLRIIIHPWYLAIPFVREWLLAGGCLAPDEATWTDVLLNDYYMILFSGAETEVYETQRSCLTAHSIHLDRLVTELKSIRENVNICTMVLLGEQEDGDHILARLLISLRRFIGTKLRIHIPPFPLAWFSNHDRHVIFGKTSPVQLSLLSLYLAREWLFLVDEARCMIRKRRRYYDNELVECHAILQMRSQFDCPRLDRS